MAAQGVVLISSVVTSLLVPKIMGVTQFGYWQLFIFYCSYVGFFHFGLNDGVYLINGGIKRAEIDKKSLNSQFLVGTAYQTLISIAIILFALFTVDDADRLFVAIMTCLYLLITNAASYIGYVLQAMDETRLFSAFSAINGALFLIPLVLLLFLGIERFQPYVISYTIAHGLALLVCFWWVRDFVPQGLLSFRVALHETYTSIRCGIKLMLANTASYFILGVSRFIIDMQWDIEVFSFVSYAFSMTTFFLIFASQASMVLFPALRQADDCEKKAFFIQCRDGLDILLPFFYILYFPVVLLLQWWLPQYQESFIYLAFLMPMVLFEGKMDMVGKTFLLVLRMEKSLLGINLIAVLISVIGACLGAYLFHSIEVMISAAVIAICWRSLYVEWKISKGYNISLSLLSIEALALSLIFVIALELFSPTVAFLAITLAYAVFILVNKDRLNDVFIKMKRFLI